MTLLDRLEDLQGCTLVHVDRGRGLVVFWTGGAAFLEYWVKDGVLVEGDAWSSYPMPKDSQTAQMAASVHYGLAVSRSA